MIYLNKMMIMSHDWVNGWIYEWINDWMINEMIANMQSSRLRVAYLVATKPLKMRDVMMNTR